jgi:hypothetical protein
VKFLHPRTVNIPCWVYTNPKHSFVFTQSMVLSFVAWIKRMLCLSYSSCIYATSKPSPIHRLYHRACTKLPQVEFAEHRGVLLALILGTRRRKIVLDTIFSLDEWDYVCTCVAHRTPCSMSEKFWASFSTHS